MARHLIALLAACSVALGIAQLVRVGGTVAETIVGMLAFQPGLLAVLIWARAFTELSRLLNGEFGKLVLVVVLVALNMWAVSAVGGSGAPWAMAVHGGLAVVAGVGYVFVFWLRAELRARSGTAQPCAARVRS